MALHYLYQWSAQTLAGELISGEMVATSQRQAKKQLLQHGRFPLAVRCTRYLPIRFSEKIFLAFFTRQLATLLRAGITLQAALPLIIAGQKSTAWRWLLQQITQEIAQGTSFSRALRQYPTIFDPLYCSLITVGELTGKLERCCLQAAMQQEKQLHLRRCIHRALFYPLFTLVTTLVVTLLLLTAVIPQFQEIYHSFNVDPPPLTQGILTFSRAVETHGVLVCGVTSGLLLGYRMARSRAPRLRAREQALLLDLPLLGRRLHQYCLARFTRTLSIMLASGLSLSDSLEEAGKGAGNMVYQRAAATVLLDIRQGISLSVAFSRQRLFPSLLPQMVAIGEAAGTLGSLLTNAADFYEAQVDESTDRLVKILEPLTIAIVGIIVGVLVVAVYLPILQLGQVIH